MVNILIIGASGLIGKAIINEMGKSDYNQIYGTYYGKTCPLPAERSIKLDLDHEEEIRFILDRVQPHAVISCLRGDFGKQLILHQRISEYLKHHGGALYYFSTANVFDKDLSMPHSEMDQCSAISEYGLFKINCEEMILRMVDTQSCILRLPQIWGKESPRLKQIREAIENNGEIEVFPKLLLNTSSDVLVAKQLRYIIEKSLTGIFHLAAEDIMSQKDFMEELIQSLIPEGRTVNPLTPNRIRYIENMEQGYFALTSKSSVFPKELRYSNKQVIESLVECIK